MSSMSPEERLAILRKVLYPPIWPSDLELPLTPEGETNNVHNYNTIFQLIQDRTFTFESLFHWIQKLRKDGDLVKINAGPPDPRDNYPFEEVEAIKCVRTVADVKKLESNLDLLKKYQHLTPTSKPYQEINARMQHIRDNKIAYYLGKNLAPENEPKKNVVTVEVPEPIREAHKLIDALTIRDIATTNSSGLGGKWSTLSRLQDRLKKNIDDMHFNRRVPAAKIKVWVEDEIRKACESSIR